MILRLTNIQRTSTSKDFRNLLNTYGVVSKVMCCPNSIYITMQNDKRAKIAVSNLNGMKWKGKSITLKPAPITTKAPICRTAVGTFRLF